MSIKKYNEKNCDWRQLLRHFWPGFPADGALANLMSYLQIDQTQVCAWCDVTPRTLRRWLASDCPAWVPLYLLARCGYLLHWPGWMVRDGRLIGAQAASTKHSGLTADCVSDFAYALQRGRSASVSLHDLARENDLLRALLLKTDTLAKLPPNVRLFPGVSAESLFKQQNGV